MIPDYQTIRRNPRLLARLTLAVAFIPLLVLCAATHFYLYNQIQIKLAQQSVNNAASNIQSELDEKKRLSTLLIDHNKVLLGKILDDSENIHLLSELIVNTRDFFPDNFAVSIADNSGEILLDDFDGHIGDLCRIDLKNQLETSQSSVRVHPNPSSYHYDIVTDWNHNKQRYLLFASFKPDNIKHILRSQEIFGQMLSLVIKKYDYLIEVTSSGDRSTLKDGNKMNLSKLQVTNIMAEKNIHNSYWTILSVRDSRLYINKLIKDIIFYAIIYLLYLMVLMFTTRNLPQHHVS